MTYPQQQPYPMAARPTSGMAIASMVLSLVGVSALGVIFGHVALSDIQKTGKDGRGMAIAGVVLGYIGVVLYTLLIVAMVSVAAEVEPYMDYQPYLGDWCAPDATVPEEC